MAVTYLSIKNSIVVTGALGNLGWKLMCHLATRNIAPRVVGLDKLAAAPDQLKELRSLAKNRRAPKAVPQTELVQCDLTDWNDRRWRDEIEQAGAIVHFAAQNPFPDATWSDAMASLDMTINLLLAGGESDHLTRVVFASSNHVMGGYKDLPITESLSGRLVPSVGTVWQAGSKRMNSTPYATAKFAGERLCRAQAVKASGRTSYVCIRIGWCQPGENIPQAISASGTPKQKAGGENDNADQLAETRRWFREMWLSNRDFVQLSERAITAKANGWPEGFIVVNGMSNNRGMKWSLAGAKRWLGYAPQDDIHDY